MKLTRQGVEYTYHGDTLTYFWPWKARNGKFYSAEYSTYFSSFRDYWKHVGMNLPSIVRSREKLVGYSFEEITAQWVRCKFPFEAIVVLFNIELSAKSLAFWAKVPKEKMEYMSKDVVILRCNDKTEVTRLIESIDPSFADAFGYCEGNLIDYNMKETEAA
ncbi:hypothetical protein D3C87_279750 [compost metagenome]